MSRVPVARIVGVFGVRGALKCKPTPVGEDVLRTGASFTLAAAGAAPSVRVIDLQRHHERTVARFEGIEDRDAANALVGSTLYAERDQITLAPDEYLVENLVGLRVQDESGEALGTVIAVEHSPANDYLVLDPGRKMIPLVKQVVCAVDVAAGIVNVRWDALPHAEDEPGGGRRRPSSARSRR